jgi:hypothetical protein
MSAFSVSRFYAADDVDSAFSQHIESLFNLFTARQMCKSGWHVDLQNSSPGAHRATITDPEGISKSYAILNAAQSDFSENLLTQYWQYVARNLDAGDDNRDNSSKSCRNAYVVRRLKQLARFVGGFRSNRFQ